MSLLYSQMMLRVIWLEGSFERQTKGSLSWGRDYTSYLTKGVLPRKWEDGRDALTSLTQRSYTDCTYSAHTLMSTYSEYYCKNCTLREAVFFLVLSFKEIKEKKENFIINCLVCFMCFRHQNPCIFDPIAGQRLVWRHEVSHERIKG